MRKYIYILLVVIGASCTDDFLNKTPMTELSPEFFWQTETDLQLGLNYLYRGINSGLTGDIRTIDTYSESQNAVSAGNNSAPNSDGVYNNSYTYIRIANDFLENYENATVSESVKNRYKGEALFFRAFYHFQLCKRFGDIIIARNTLDFASDELYGARDSRDDVIAFIMGDLEEASEYLPKKSEIASEAYGRITKGANDAFASRVALYFGTLKKYSGETGSEALLQKAKSFADKVITSQEYSLFELPSYENFSDLFYEENEANDETILAFQYSRDHGSYNIWVRALITDNYSSPLKNLADAFLMNNGLPITHPSSGFSGYTTKNSEFENRDPRMCGTFYRPGIDTDNAGEIFEINSLGTFSTTGYCPRKYTYLDAVGDLSGERRYGDVMVIRYAEVLLNYAEASFELGATGGELDQVLNKSINLLRDRVGMPHLTTIFVTNNSLDMLTEIRRERQVELANESFRYDDLIRWRTAVAELNQDVLGATTKVYSAFAGKKKTIDGVDFVWLEEASTRNFTEKNYLFPLPIVQWQLNENLLPNNPGWE